jgi:predicted RNase H-like HicB family nuclease
MTSRYTVRLEYDEDSPGYVVSVPSLPGCFTQGPSVPEALERAKEAIAGHVAALRELGEDVPKEHVPADAIVVQVEILPPAKDQARSA